MLLRHKHKPNGGLWGLPAGKVDEEEDVLTAMQRELFEETGIACEVDDLSYVRSVLVRHDETDFAYHMYRLPLPEIPRLQLSETEHADHAWFSPEESLQIAQVLDQADCTQLVYGL